MDDAHDQIETAIRARLETIPGSKGSFGFEDMPLRDRDLPGTVADLGTETFDRLSEGGFGEAYLQRSLQIDVVVLVDVTRKEFRAEARTLRNSVIATLADVTALGVAGLETLSLLSSSPHQFTSEKGAQGGFHLAYRATFISPESDPGSIVPLR